MNHQAGGPRTDRDSIYLHSSRWDELLTSVETLRVRPHGDEWWLYEVTTRKLVNVGCRNLLAMELWTAQLRGLKYYQERRSDTRPGRVATLVREPNNEHDSFAVAVFADGVKVGYLPKMMARRVSKRLDGGISLTAIFIAGARPGVEAGRVRVIAAKRDTLDLLQSAPPRAQPTPTAAPREPAAEPAEGFWSRAKRAFFG